ncbi:tetratricopeptide repeat protein [Pseudoxanthobacter sp.]|uniref:tetratricopeptide repeat protein n=1 Tax=Pseudoxanthobacter sp. TaxID=1925742 RepID=UPI002FE002E8
MADIFHEIQEDMRRERFRGLWNRFGVHFIVLVVLVIAGTAGWRGYVAWQDSKARAGGDQFYAALETASKGDHKAAIDALNQLVGETGGGYAILGRFRVAAEQATAGDTAAAIAGFDAIAADGSVPVLYRNLAHVRAGYLALAGSDPKAAAARVSSLAGEAGGPWRQPAREIMGLAAYAGGDLATARRYFTDIIGDADGPREAAERARIMLSLIQAASGPVEVRPAPATGNGS